jgi:hypothetical protein
MKCMLSYKYMFTVLKRMKEKKLSRSDNPLSEIVPA